MMAEQSGYGAGSEKQSKRYKLLAVFFLIMVVFFTSNISFALEKTPKYQVVVGNDEKAYLLDTSTGFTWILTYRTMATGREPVAIPYKFIVENIQGVSLPPNGTPAP